MFELNLTELTRRDMGLRDKLFASWRLIGYVYNSYRRNWRVAPHCEGFGC